jgi:hypothetical protein
MTTSATRRAVLAGVAAMPALTASAAMASPATDHQLLVLDRELKAAHALMEAASNRCSECNERAAAMQPPEIAAPQPPEEIRHLWETATGYAINMLAATQPEHPYFAWRRDTEEQRAAADQANRAAWLKAQHDSGSIEAQAEFDDAHEEMMAIFDEMMETPAHSVAGMLVKVEAAYLIEVQDDPGNVWESIVADFRRLGGGAQS